MSPSEFWMLVQKQCQEKGGFSPSRALVSTLFVHRSADLSNCNCVGLDHRCVWFDDWLLTERGIGTKKKNRLRDAHASCLEHIVLRSDAPFAYNSLTQRQDERVLASHLPQASHHASLLCINYIMRGMDGAGASVAMMNVIRRVVRATVVHWRLTFERDVPKGLCSLHAFASDASAYCSTQFQSLEESDIITRFTFLSESARNTLADDVRRCKRIIRNRCRSSEPHVTTSPHNCQSSAHISPKHLLSDSQLVVLKTLMSQRPRIPGLANTLAMLVGDMELGPITNTTNILLQEWLDKRFPTADAQRTPVCSRVCRAMNHYLITDPHAVLVSNKSFLVTRPPRLSRQQHELVGIIGDRCQKIWNDSRRPLQAFSLRRLMRVSGWIIEDCFVRTVDEFEHIVCHKLQSWLETHTRQRYNGVPYPLYVSNIKQVLHMVLFLANAIHPASRSLTFKFEQTIWPLQDVTTTTYSIDNDIHAPGHSQMPPLLMRFADMHGCLEKLTTFIERAWTSRARPLSQITYRATIWRIGFALRTICPLFWNPGNQQHQVNGCPCISTVTTRQLHEMVADLHMHHMDPTANPLRFTPRRPINTAKAAGAQKILSVLNMMIRDSRLFDNISHEEPPLQWATVLEIVCSRCRNVGGGTNESADMQRIYGWQETYDANELGQMCKRDHLDEDDIEHIRAYMEGADRSARVLKFKLLFEIALATGLRRGEIARLQHSSIVNLDTGLPPSLSSVQQKGGRPRLFVSTAEMAAACVAYLKHPTFSRIAQSTEFLFPARQLTSRSRRHVCAGSIGRAITQLLLLSGIDRHRAHAHAFRKTVVVRLWRAGNSMESISKFLCHTNINTTYKHYLDVSYPELAGRMKQPDDDETADVSAFASIGMQELLLLREALTALPEK